ncbi:DUF6371 domain-containing protein [Flavobacteriaceae bacterium F89]|uniref:DUF6371 domain-containing protein n=1 Tax=Cerina litoralis TaxID=2874477 RepID=A0AAE3EVF0_9FLAO|nr:DUF6371 domain-containing protein [Cerina litoralis]MCG2460386.1 DUF6371 domain-containing protein [Cerina litoralis]
MENEVLKFDRNRNRVKYCPCNKKNRDGKFVPYVGYDNKGFCHSCGETFLPELDKTDYKREMKFEPPKLSSYHDPKLISRCGRNFRENNFVQFLKSVFRPDDVKQAILTYCIGTSKHWAGANIFWQIDHKNNVQHGKIMLYDTETGKRSKNQEGKAYISSVRSIQRLKDFNLKQCLFGLHLINENKTRTIALVEGEKTAIIMSIFKPEYLWMATGSKGGFKYEMLKPIKDFNIIAFPDKGEIYEWKSTAMELNGFGFRITVNDWMEGRAEYSKGTDLADVYLDEVKKPQSPEAVATHYKPLTETGTTVISNLESNVNRMAQRNPNLWLLIDKFGLTDGDGNEIRKVS